MIAAGIDAPSFLISRISPLSDHRRVKLEPALLYSGSHNPCEFRYQWLLEDRELANILQESIRRLALQGTDLAQSYVGTIRLKLLKIGAVIIRNTR